MDELSQKPIRPPSGAIAVAVVAMAVLVLGVGLWRVITSREVDTPAPASPHVEIESTRITFTTVADTRQFAVAVALANRGRAQVTVESFGADAANLRLLEAGALRGTDPSVISDPSYRIPSDRTFDLAAGEHRIIALRYAVENCRHAEAKDVRVPVTVTSAGRTTTVRLHMPDIDVQPWTTYLVQTACS